MAANVQSMYNFWKNFDLQELQRELDATATDLANRQDESEGSRKRLVEQSREFKKNTPEDIRKIAAPLLKSFQGEIDSLSKRSKTAEGAFLSVYKRLIDLPDPLAVLEQALQAQKRAQRVSDLEIENKQLRETLEDYNNEFAEVKNQEVTIKQLKERLREYEDKLESTADARAKDKERELQRLFADKERQLQETQLSVVRKLGEAEQKNASLQSSLDSVQSELFELKSKYDEATSAKSDEMDMVMADLERANERATSAEREAERLRQQLVAASQSVQQASNSMRQTPDRMEQALDILSRSSMEVELAAKEKEVAQLVEDVQKLQVSLSKLRESTATKVAKLEEELSKKNKALAMLEEKLCSQEDYEEIKRELNVLKSMEFNGGGDGCVERGKGKSLEVLLLEKNKALQNENTSLKLSNADHGGRGSAVSAQPSSSVSPNPSSVSADDVSTNTFAQLVGEELVHQYRPRSLPRSATPATSTVHSPPATPTSVSSNHPGANALGVLDHRHFSMPPPSPFYGFPGLGVGPPFHPAFMPVNMVKAEQLNSASSGGLDTMYVAKNVRELLAVHNIGQRLFAKHVLGLSQGTVSELLSKPKSWDKLTEKGRESYRKMHTWATDESNIMALKAMSPKKSTSSTPLTNNPKEDTATEDRIATILSEAHQAMQAKKVAEQQVAASVVSSIYQLEMNRMVAAHPHLVMGHTQLSPTSPSSLPPHLHHLNNNSQHPNHSFSRSIKTKREAESSRYETGQARSRHSSDRSESSENCSDMVVRIYRQELMKLKNAADTAGNQAASNMYREELDRLNAQIRQMPPAPSPHQDVGPICAERERQQMRQQFTDRPQVNGGLLVKAEPPDSTSDDPIDLSSKPHSSSTPSSSSSPTDTMMGGEGRQSGSAFSMVRSHSTHRVNGHESGGESSPQTPTTPGTPLGSCGEAMSPLQRMQNIANSLTSRPHLGMTSAKPLKSVLPPISQEEFDCYSNINTEDLVRKVKETLSQYSISQRLFGESVLGLSQGSVSDLLARPKPWHMLTQKGREPFIRMQIFLSDAESIPKLVQSQYRIAPEKLVRSNSHNDTESASNPPTTPTAVMPVGDQVSSRSQGSTSTTLPSSHLTTIPHSPSTASSSSAPPHPPPPVLPPPPPLGSPPALVVSHLPSLLPPPAAASHKGLQMRSEGIGSLPLMPHPGVGVVSPTTASQRQWGYFAFPSSMLEVWAMTSDIETLALTARVKDVLQFHNLGQKLFGEAVLGLSQGSVSELLSKPKPWHMLSIKGREPFIKMHLWLSDAQNIEQLKYYQSQIKANRRRKSSVDERGFDSPSTPKRPRVFFTEEQKDALRLAYNQDPYPNQTTIESLASDLGVGVKTVVNWFHNHRMRAKQQHHTSGGGGTLSDGDQGNSSSGFKSEPLDECSNQSDLSNVSGDAAVSAVASAVAAAAVRQMDAQSQWMFPQFEPVGLLQRKSSDEWDGDSLDDRLDETDGAAPCDGRADSGIKSPESVSFPPPPPAPPVGVNKRKRSNPQRVYEGVQLERAQLERAKIQQMAAAAPKAVLVPGVPDEEGDTRVSASEDAQEPSTSTSGLGAYMATPPLSPSDGDDRKGEELCDLRSEREERITKLEQGLDQSTDWGDEGDDSCSLTPSYTYTTDPIREGPRRDGGEKQSSASKSDDWQF